MSGWSAVRALLDGVLVREGVGVVVGVGVAVGLRARRRGWRRERCALQLWGFGWCGGTGRSGRGLLEEGEACHAGRDAGVGGWGGVGAGADGRTGGVVAVLVLAVGIVVHAAVHDLPGHEGGDELVVGAQEAPDPLVALDELDVAQDLAAQGLALVEAAHHVGAVGDAVGLAVDQLHAVEEVGGRDRGVGQGLQDGGFLAVEVEAGVPVLVALLVLLAGGEEGAGGLGAGARRGRRRRHGPGVLPRRLRARVRALAAVVWRRGFPFPFPFPFHGKGVLLGFGLGFADHARGAGLRLAVGFVRELLVQVGDAGHALGGAVGGGPSAEERGTFVADFRVDQGVAGQLAQALEERLVDKVALEAGGRGR